MSFSLNDELRRQVTENLSRLERIAVDDQELRQAAVAIVITSAEQDDEACVLLTRRSSTIKRHAGQYALPGGRFEPGEDAEQAALRELEEELGLAISADQIIGRLDDFATRSGFCITPVVTWGDGHAKLSPDPNEVEKVFHIPLTELNRPEIPKMMHVEGTEDPVFAAPLPTVGHEVYAPTAAMLYQFREVALRNRMTRVAHYEQPQFAWR